MADLLKLRKTKYLDQESKEINLRDVLRQMENKHALGKDHREPGRVGNVAAPAEVVRQVLDGLY